MGAYEALSCLNIDKIAKVCYLSIFVWADKDADRLVGKVMKTRHKSGFSLIEIMVAALLLAVIAVGGAAVLSHTGVSIKIQGGKRVAIELANARLETARAQNYYGLNGIIPPLLDVEDRYFLTDANGDHILDLNDGRQTDQISLGGKTFIMVTEIVRRSSDASPDFNTEFLDVTVSVRYRPGSTEEVKVRALFIPPYVTEG